MIAGFVGRMRFDRNYATKEDAMSLAHIISLPQGARTVVDTCGAFAIATAAQIIPGCSEDKLIISDKENLILVGSGSIYNREKLIMFLGCGNDVTELELMWYAWLKWGNDVTSYLDGDWMLAAYDKRKNELLLARSWGHSSLYFYREDNFIAFATQPSSLTALPDIPREPNIHVITQILCALPIEPSSTSWKDIYQLQPASKIEISNGHMREHIWWRPSNIQQRQYVNEKDIFDKFVSLYTTSVKKRLRTSQEVGATLSAGLDSSSVCLLAAQELAPYGKTLNAWTSAPHYTDEATSFGRWLTDERVIAANVAQSLGNIRHTIVEAGDSDPIDAIRLQLLRTGRPQSSVANLYWIDQILMLAAESSCGILMTGQFGNSTVSYSPFNIPLLPKTKYYPNTSWRSYLGLLKLKMIKNMRKVKQDIYGLRHNAQFDYPIINQKYVLSEDFKRSINTLVNPYKISHADITEVHMGSFDIWYHNSFWSGVEVRDPTMDTELTEFLLSLPDNMFFQDGLDRRMLRLGMKDVLPDEVRLNRRRGQQASDIVPRVRRFSNQAVHALAITNNSMLARDLLNMEQMHLILEKIKQGETGLKIFQECSRILLPGLSVGLFLATFDTDYDLSIPLDQYILLK